MSFIHTTDNATNTEPKKKWTACAVPLPVCVGKKKKNGASPACRRRCGTIRASRGGRRAAAASATRGGGPADAPSLLWRHARHHQPRQG